MTEDKGRYAASAAYPDGRVVPNALFRELPIYLVIETCTLLDPDTKKALTELSLSPILDSPEAPFETYWDHFTPSQQAQLNTAAEAFVQEDLRRKSRGEVYR